MQAAIKLMVAMVLVVEYGSGDAGGSEAVGIGGTSGMLWQWRW